MSSIPSVKLPREQALSQTGTETAKRKFEQLNDKIQKGDLTYYSKFDRLFDRAVVLLQKAFSLGPKKLENLVGSTKWLKPEERQQNREIARFQRELQKIQSALTKFFPTFRNQQGKTVLVLPQEIVDMSKHALTYFQWERGVANISFDATETAEVEAPRELAIVPYKPLIPFGKPVLTDLAKNILNVLEEVKKKELETILNVQDQPSEDPVPLFGQIEEDFLNEEKVVEENKGSPSKESTLFVQKKKENSIIGENAPGIEKFLPPFEEESGRASPETSDKPDSTTSPSATSSGRASPETSDKADSTTSSSATSSGRASPVEDDGDPFQGVFRFLRPWIIG